jgi:hypothetical protein
MRNARLEEEYGGLKRQIGELINIASLSVHKAAYETTYEEEEYLPRHRVRRPYRTAVGRVGATTHELSTR